MNSKRFHQILSSFVCLATLSLLMTMTGRAQSIQSIQLQGESSQNAPWLNVGFGGATHRFVASVDVSYPINHHLLSAHIIYMAEAVFIIPAPQSFGGDPSSASKDIEYAILYGLHVNEDFAIASISSGVSMVRSIHFSQYGKEDVTSAGIPLKIEVLFNGGQHFSWGPTYFANFNGHYSYSGGWISFAYRFEK